jgi:lipopolysaccharide transport system ATP-binding protein
MDDIAIRAQGLGKQYRIGRMPKGYATLRDSLMGSLWSTWRRMGMFLHGQTAGLGTENETIWALKDVSFEVKRGEVIGIIGRNGAGKSTLLKVLARITEPTEGQAEIYGRVGSLLEVGTGFHPELTGRENVYLSGAILGMRKEEIVRKFDEIVSFSGVEQFIDTPVKHYSSGMYLRLAFAVAAHLDPEILIVDEVLAVGDAAFQKKCLGKMESVAKEGRTIFFVSHNMPAVTRLCQRVIYLDEGKLCHDGSSHEAIKAYLHSGLGTMHSREWLDADKAPGGEVVRLRAARVRTEDRQCTEKIDIRRPVGLEVEYEVLRPGYKLMPALALYNEEGVCAFTAFEHDPAWRGRIRPPGRYRSTAWIPGNYLAEGTMFVDVGLGTREPNIFQYHERQVVAFQVVDSADGDSARADFAREMPGVVRPLLNWTTEFSPEGFPIEPATSESETKP